MANARTLYDILGVSPTAAKEEITKAYRVKAMQWHPDRNPTPNATEEMQLINSAYEVLRNEESRIKYDRTGEPRNSPNRTSRSSRPYSYYTSAAAAREELKKEFHRQWPQDLADLAEAMVSEKYWTINEEWWKSIRFTTEVMRGAAPIEALIQRHLDRLDLNLNKYARTYRGFSANDPIHEQIILLLYYGIEKWNPKYSEITADLFMSQESLQKFKIHSPENLTNFIQQMEIDPTLARIFAYTLLTRANSTHRAIGLSMLTPDFLDSVILNRLALLYGELNGTQMEWISKRFNELSNKSKDKIIDSIMRKPQSLTEEMFSRLTQRIGNESVVRKWFLNNIELIDRLSESSKHHLVQEYLNLKVNDQQLIHDLLPRLKPLLSTKDLLTLSHKLLLLKRLHTAEDLVVEVWTKIDEASKIETLKLYGELGYSFENLYKTTADEMVYVEFVKSLGTGKRSFNNYSPSENQIEFGLSHSDPLVVRGTIKLIGNSYGMLSLERSEQIGKWISGLILHDRAFLSKYGDGLSRLGFSPTLYNQLSWMQNTARQDNYQLSTLHAQQKEALVGLAKNIDHPSIINWKQQEFHLNSVHQWPDEFLEILVEKLDSTSIPQGFKRQIQLRREKQGKKLKGCHEILLKVGVT